MGYAGQPMKVIKANRALLRKRSFKDIKKLYQKSAGKTELEFKQVSALEMKVIKKKISQQLRQNARNEIGIYILDAILVMGILYGFWWWLAV